ncbi:MAG: DNA polymerase I [candidate division WOR-3 bacterium]
MASGGKRLLLIDGHSLIYRSFFAFIRQPLRNSKGRNTSAVFGFANTLRKLLKTLKPEYCAVVFDAPGKTFRHEKLEQYKIQRPPAPEELPEQIPVVKKMVKGWGLASFEQTGVEADDVLATLARRFASQGFEVVIATSDKDLLQLVGGRITAYDPWQEKLYGSEEVREKLGVGPELVCDFLALTGDSSDNIPGVPGIGPKRALEILTRYGSLATALEREPKLRGHESVARLSRELVEVRDDVDVAARPEDLVTGKPDIETLSDIFREMEFDSLLRELGPAKSEAGEVVELRGDVPERGIAVFSLGTGLGLWFTLDGEKTTFVPADRNDAVRRFLTGQELTKVGFDIKSKVKQAWQAGIALAGPLFDVGVAAWLVDPNRRSYGLEDVTAQLLGRPILPAGLQDEPALVWQLFKHLESDLAALGLERVAGEIEMPLIPVLAEMEERGVGLDVDYLGRLEQELGQEADRVQKSIWNKAGVEFNVGSPKQLAGVLFERLKLPRGRRTKTGFSTDSVVLEELASQHPVIQDILYFRELTKLRNTYIGPLREMARPGTNRIHCEFNQTGTGTGRLSSSNPNLQNIPIRTELGRRIRQAFVAGPGKVLLSADYSQIELRVLAHIANDEELKRAFEQKEDIHVHTAAAVFGVAAEAVTPEQRRMAKVVNYGLIYGMGDYGLSWRMGIPREQARGFLDDYMTRFAGVAAWRERVLAEVHERGFVRSLSGRIRPLPGVTSKNRNVVEAARRAAINAPVQGSAADIMKQAMLNVNRRLKEERLEAGIIVQVHDELLVEVDENCLAEVKLAVRQEMEAAWKLDVPLVVDIGTGKTWGEAH